MRPRPSAAPPQSDEEDQEEAARRGRLRRTTRRPEPTRLQPLPAGRPLWRVEPTERPTPAHVRPSGRATPEQRSGAPTVGRAAERAGAVQPAAQPILVRPWAAPEPQRWQPPPPDQRRLEAHREAVARAQQIDSHLARPRLINPGTVYGGYWLMNNGSFWAWYERRTQGDRAQDDGEEDTEGSGSGRRGQRDGFYEDPTTHAERDAEHEREHWRQTRDRIEHLVRHYGAGHWGGHTYWGLGTSPPYDPYWPGSWDQGLGFAEHWWPGWYQGYGAPYWALYGAPEVAFGFTPDLDGEAWRESPETEAELRQDLDTMHDEWGGVPPEDTGSRLTLGSTLWHWQPLSLREQGNWHDTTTYEDYQLEPVWLFHAHGLFSTPWADFSLRISTDTLSQMLSPRGLILDLLTAFTTASGRRLTLNANFLHFDQGEVLLRKRGGGEVLQRAPAESELVLIEARYEIHELISLAARYTHSSLPRNVYLQRGQDEQMSFHQISEELLKVRSDTLGFGLILGNTQPAALHTPALQYALHTLVAMGPYSLEGLRSGTALDEGWLLSMQMGVELAARVPLGAGFSLGLRDRLDLQINSPIGLPDKIERHLRERQLDPNGWSLSFGTFELINQLMAEVSWQW